MLPPAYLSEDLKYLALLPAGAEGSHLHHPGAESQRRRRVVASRAADNLVLRYAPECVDDPAIESRPRRLEYAARITRPNDQFAGRGRRR